MCNILACEQALCLGKKIARKAFPSPLFPARPKACSQASNILAPTWVIDYFIAFNVPIYDTIDKGNYRVRQ